MYQNFRLRTRPFENIVGKGENTGNQLFILFLQPFLPHEKQKLNFVACKCFNLVIAKMLSFGKELICGLQMLSIWTSLEFRHLVKELILFLPEHCLYRWVSAILS